MKTGRPSPAITEPEIGDAGEGEGEQNAAGRPVGFRIVVCGVPVGGGDQEEGGKPGLDDEMHHRRQGVGSVEDEDEEGPGQDAGRGRKGEPAPQAKARDPVGGQDHEDEIDHQRPGLRFVRGDEERASHGAEQAESRPGSGHAASTQPW